VGLVVGVKGHATSTNCSRVEIATTNGREMLDLTIQGVTDEVHTLLRQRAAENRRTLNDEVLVVLEEGVRRNRASLDRPWLEEIRAFRESLNVPPLTEEFLDLAINEGRS
jgi:plasmid stability protein